MKLVIHASLLILAGLSSSLVQAAVADLAEFNQGLIFLNQGAMAIDASLSLNISAVPLPPSMTLFASAGLIGLVGCRKSGSWHLA